MKRACTLLCALLLLTALPAGASNVKNSGDYRYTLNEEGNCDALTAITLPEGLHTIEEAAFSGCIGLTGLTLPPGCAPSGAMPLSAVKACR